MAKVLIIDDDLYIRELYEEILKDAGHEVDSAADGSEGLKKLQTNHYDLTLLDVMMPKIDGLGILTKLKETPPPVPLGKILLLTNLAHGPVIKEGIEKGAVGYLIKADLTPDQLMEKLQSYLK